jgi:hypothetical protein
LARVLGFRRAFWASPCARVANFSVCVRLLLRTAPLSPCARLLSLSLSVRGCSLSLRAAAAPCARLQLAAAGCCSPAPWARGCYLFPSTGRVVGPPPLLFLRCQDSRMMFLTSSSPASPGFRLSGFCQVSRTQDCAASRFLSSVKTASSSE